jgi:hypothetical protein
LEETGDLRPSAIRQTIVPRGSEIGLDLSGQSTIDHRDAPHMLPEEHLAKQKRFKMPLLTETETETKTKSHFPTDFAFERRLPVQYGERLENELLKEPGALRPINRQTRPESKLMTHIAKPDPTGRHPFDVPNEDVIFVVIMIRDQQGRYGQHIYEWFHADTTFGQLESFPAFMIPATSEDLVRNFAFFSDNDNDDAIPKDITIGEWYNRHPSPYTNTLFIDCTVN